MRTEILDIDKLQNISPETISAYLEKNGWDVIESRSNPACSIWKHPSHDGREAFVLLPLDREVPDFSFRVYDLIRVLAVVEDRSLENIFNSLGLVRESVLAKKKSEEYQQGISLPADIDVSSLLVNLFIGIINLLRFKGYTRKP
jgi:hypothetical protein